MLPWTFSFSQGILIGYLYRFSSMLITGGRGTNQAFSLRHQAFSLRGELLNVDI